MSDENDIDVELLRDKPTLFADRLREFLSDEQSWQVMVVLSEVCNHCWDNELPCHCTNDD